MIVEAIQAAGDVGAQLFQAWANAQVQVVNETFWAREGPVLVIMPCMILAVLIFGYVMYRLEKK